jgi:hypothetical protein
LAYSIAELIACASAFAEKCTGLAGGLPLSCQQGKRRMRLKQFDLPVSKATGGVMPGIDLNRWSELEADLKAGGLFFRSGLHFPASFRRERSGVLLFGNPAAILKAPLRLK